VHTKGASRALKRKLDNSGDIVKVCLVGQFNDSLDEGKRNVGKSLKIGLELQDIEVEKVDISSVTEWRAIKSFRPDIIHFILTPTFLGVLTARLVSSAFHSAKTVISAVHPSLRPSQVLKLFGPDLVLVQSRESTELFQSMGMKTRFFPNGVDVIKFKPASERRKNDLRAQFQISRQDFVVLHLASLRRERNLDIFKKIQAEEGIQVLILGRENEAADRKLLRELREAGCLVWVQHFPHVDQIYNMSDCYVFPTVHKKACIETPLSVLEAMACNLPIISTRFGALPTLFNEGSGLFFTENVEYIPRIALDVKNSNVPVETRANILPLAWDNLTQDLIGIYKDLLR
jgi:glycosyltransferase involved in cell wall biosynthesis